MVLTINTTGLRADSTPLLRDVRLQLESSYGVPFIGVGALLYRDGHDFQGLHTDGGSHSQMLIAIVVLGARRPFVVRARGTPADMNKRAPAGGLPSDIVFHPGEGDLIVMGGALQRGWLHGVPATETRDRRIS